MKNILLTIILVLVASFGVYTLLNKKGEELQVPLQNEERVVFEEKEIVPDPVKGVPMVDYSPEALTQANKDGRVVLFFHAVWCSTCKSAIRDINMNYEDLPEDLTIVMVNYDEETELKKQYGVFTQHTLVQIDKDGNEITKWVGGGVSTINSNLE